MTDSTTSPALKRCSRCREIKSLDMFYCDKKRKDGLRRWCKVCNSAATCIWGKVEHAERKQGITPGNKNPEKSRAYSRRWYKNNAEKARIDKRAWRKANPEKIKENYRRRYRENPDKFKAQGHRYRTKKKGNGGYFTGKDIAHMRAIQQGHCCYCGRLGQPERIDHIHPVKYGGPSDPWNLALCCPTCNSSKGAKTLEQWTDRWYLPKK